MSKRVLESLRIAMHDVDSSNYCLLCVLALSIMILWSINFIHP